MYLKITCLPLKAGFFQLLLFTFFLLSCNLTKAQCAGEDASITICNIPDPTNQNINLFNLLGGTPTPGGTWTDLQQSGGLNISTGILNVWGINESDTYVFVYTVNDASCADNVATVTVTIGGYAGISNPNASACDDNNSVNLFQFLGNFPNPQQNGYWRDDSGSGALRGNFLDATVSGLGTFSFTYTMPAIGSCPSVSATVDVTVHPAPEPGVTSDLILCDSDDMSIYTNLNLLDYIFGQDPGGKWSEGGTSELSGPEDTFINVQNIYNTFGPGEYGFTYTVQPSHPVCNPKSSTIKIIIEEQLDFTGSTLVIASDICEDEIGRATFVATLTQGLENIPNGNYNLQYQITGPISSGNTILVRFENGVVTFPIPAISFPFVGAYTLSIVNIHETTGYNACDHIIGDISDILNVYPLPKINAGTLTIENACQESDVEVRLSGNINLADGDYRITYDLGGSNTASAQQVIMTVVGGVGTFILPSSQLTNPGNMTIVITHIINLQTLCENTASLSQSFIILPKPDVSNVRVTINDVCESQPVIANFSGFGMLTSIQITYSLTGANTASGIVTIAAVNGTAVFTIPANQLLNTGTTTFTISEIVNNETSCGAGNLSITDSFTIYRLPETPVVNNMEFCQSENATVADLVPNGTSYIWYASESGSPLSSDTVLTSGNYYVATVSPFGCVSQKAIVAVIITDLPPPVLETGGQNFCGLDSPAPTLANLSANVNGTGTIVWFDALHNGNQLPDSQVLQDGMTYYGFDSSATTGCISENALAVTVSLSHCGEDEYELMIPDGFSPNGDGINDTFNIPNIEFLFPDFTLEIYNRYGNVMYKGNRNTPDWDGRSNQSTVIDGVAPNGVYFYIVNFNKGNKPAKQGRLYLNR
ncbi:gliding motility-associated C-terminal domain-containing protein [Flavobacterium lindanitolerans]|uniref:gliding motility-associated C-terminal domain-containing protein n=1 Tax=Flavobacterium lindanitolerans TaxID=428988 RepID=UPI0028078521|nr:gliding motility-associated C-terminal domain-containing protein [Flavobacterium lindanitolerans]MDQ7960161.1 gliding motility-associated C-terminal domain-containing protein [Flavobacterium lindanitolerans]